MSAQVLTKMNVHGCNLNFAGKGGVVEITPCDVAASLGFGNLSDPAYYLGLARYCHDPKAEQWMRQYIREKLIVFVEDNRWKLDEWNIHGCVEIVMRESVYGMACQKCGGLGYRYPKPYSDEASGDCKHCEGSGIGQLSERERSRISGISFTTWRRNWKERINNFLAQFAQIDSELHYHIKKRL